MVAPTQISLGIDQATQQIYLNTAGVWNPIELPVGVALFADLAALPPVSGEVVTVAGYNVVGDGGGGQFYGVTGAPAGTYVDNGGTIILPTGGDGSAAWLRVYDGNLNVKWFGAVGDGVADDAAAIQLAVDALPTDGTLEFPQGTYVLTSSSTTTSAVVFAGKSGITLLGYGATIKGTATRVKSYFDFSSTSGVKIFGFNFDMMFGTLAQYFGADYPTNYNVAVYTATSATNIEVYYCSFENLYTNAVYCYSAAGSLIVDHCQFTSPAQDQGYNCQHIQAVTWQNINVTNSTFLNTPFPTASVGVPSILLAAITGEVLVADNNIDHSGRDNTFSHRLGAIDFYQSVPKFTVRNNVVTNCAESIMRIDSVKEGRIDGNYFTIAGNATLSYNGIYLQGYYAGSCENIVICNNVLEDPFNRLGVGISVLAYNWQQPSKNIEIYSNVISGVDTAFLVYNAFQNIAFRNNNVFGFNSRITVGMTYTPPDTVYGVGNEATGAMENLVIEGNSVNGAASINVNQVGFQGYASTPYSQTGAVAVTIDAPYQTFVVGSSVALRFFKTSGPDPVPVSGTYVVASMIDAGLATAAFTVTSGLAGTSAGVVDVGFRGTINDISVKNNRIIGTGLVGSIGVYIDGLRPTVTAFAYLEGNKTINLYTHYFVRNTYRTDLFHNAAGGSFTNYFYDGGGNNYVQRRFNSVSQERRQGTAVLVAGTCTVITAEILAGDTVIVSRGTAGGVLGNLSVSNIVAGTSFDIDSSSATDTSTVFWEIVH
jgi:hypothetical protein